MNARIQERLNKYSVSTKEILGEIYKDTDIGNDNIVILYSSVIDGVGTEYSDLDIYVITNIINFVGNVENFGNHVRQSELKGLNFDIEYLTYDEVLPIIDKLYKNTENVFRLSEGEIKFLYRIVVSDIIETSLIGNKIRDSIDYNILKTLVRNRNILLSYAELDEAVNFYFSNDYFSSLVCLFQSLNLAAGAYCSMNDRIIVKPKWFTKVFFEILDKKGLDKFKDKYVKYQFDDIQLTKEFVKNKINFIQEMLFNMVVIN